MHICAAASVCGSAAVQQCLMTCTSLRRSLNVFRGPVAEMQPLPCSGALQRGAFPRSAAGHGASAVLPDSSPGVRLVHRLVITPCGMPRALEHSMEAASLPPPKRRLSRALCRLQEGRSLGRSLASEGCQVRHQCADRRASSRATGRQVWDFLSSQASHKAMRVGAQHGGCIRIPGHDFGMLWP